eukprot:SAG22_NODE_725_length_7622_cov_1.958926_9_plen_178_part_00
MTVLLLQGKLPQTWPEEDRRALLQAAPVVEVCCKALSLFCCASTDFPSKPAPFHAVLHNTQAVKRTVNWKLIECVIPCRAVPAVCGPLPVWSPALLSCLSICRDCGRVLTKFSRAAVLLNKHVPCTRWLRLKHGKTAKLLAESHAEQRQRKQAAREQMHCWLRSDKKDGAACSRQHA